MNLPYDINANIVWVDIQTACCAGSESFLDSRRS
jgi:hypothetical protein